MKRFLPLALALLGCGDTALPPEDCAPPLPPSDDDGRPWPTYTEANARFAACDEDGAERRRGVCSDGKTFLERSGSFTGDTYFFSGEELVGLRRYTDIAFDCGEYHFGDASCEETDAEPIACP